MRLVEYKVIMGRTRTELEENVQEFVRKNNHLTVKLNGGFSSAVIGGDFFCYQACSVWEKIYAY